MSSTVGISPDETDRAGSFAVVVGEPTWRRDSDPAEHGLGAERLIWKRTARMARHDNMVPTMAMINNLSA